MALRRPIFEMKRRTVLRHRDRVLREYVQFEQLAPEVAVAQQRQRAIDAARFAMESTSFYRDFYRDAGLTPEDLRDPAAFSSLPVVEKAHVREHGEAFRTPEWSEKNAVVSKTGGSTGQPLHSYRDARLSVQPLEWRLFRWWGVNPWDNIALVARMRQTPRQKRVQAAKWWPSKRMQLDAYRINEDSVRAFAEKWSQVEPELLTGYAGGILQLARTLQRLDLQVKPPEAIAITASPLTTENRLEVQSILGAPVYDHYRSSEVPYMAGECHERSGHHVFADERMLEVVGDDDQPLPDGRPGQILATDMTNRVFPLIRYRMGDRSRMLGEPCPCGISLPRIDYVIGRTTDALLLPDGTWVDGAALYQIFSETPTAVRQYQVEQLADYSVVVRCVRGSDPHSDRTVALVVEDLRTKLGNTVPVNAEFVEEIPHDGGKIRLVRSAVV